MPKYALIDDTHPGLVYTGNWTPMTRPLNVNGPEFNNTYHMTNDPNATVSFNFYGTIVNLFGTIDAPAVHGVPSPIFRIDPNNYPPSVFNSSGNVAVIPDANANSATSHIRMFQSGKFAEGNYTMVVQAGDPSSSATSGNATFYFDFLTIQVGDSVYADYVILDDGSDQFHYTEGWTTGNITGAYLNTVHQTPDQGGQMTLGFHGTEISVYGTIDGPYAENATLGFFKIDGGQTHTVLAGNVTKSALLANGTEMRNQLLWRTTGLRDIGQGQHTLTISSPPALNTSSTSTSSTPTVPSASTTPAPTNPPWFLDYVVYGPSSALSPRSTSTPSPSAVASSSSAPPAGAIAGGVIGGLAGLALIILAFLFWRRRERRKEAAKEVKDGFETNYATSTAASRPTLSGRRSSIHKGSRGMGTGGGGTPGVETGPVLDISPNSPLASLSGRVGSSTMTGPGTADSAYETEYTNAARQYRPPPRPVREMDGGVRLASGSDIDSEVVEVLPPSYARYGSEA